MGCPICQTTNAAVIDAKALTPGLVVHFAKCEACGVAYQEPAMSEAEAIAYNDWGWGHPGQVPYATKAEADKRAVAQMRILPVDNSPSVFDYGAGAGGLVRLCRNRGLTADGLEISIIARIKSLDFYGVELYAEPPERTYDLVCLHSVLEHVLDGRQLLQKVVPLIAANGRILIKMPVYTGQGAGWWGYGAEHLCLYSARALFALLDQFGFYACRRWPGEEGRETFLLRRVN